MTTLIAQLAHSRFTHLLIVSPVRRTHSVTIFAFARTWGAPPSSSDAYSEVTFTALHLPTTQAGGPFTAPKLFTRFEISPLQ